MSTRITIVMGVRDEVELLEYNIEHHLKLGINKFYLIDFKSSDGSTEILKKYIEPGLADSIYMFLLNFMLKVSF